MVDEEPAKLPSPNADPTREFFDARVVQRALFDQAQRLRDGRRRAVPRRSPRRSLRQTPQARPIPRAQRGRGAGVERAVAPLRNPGGTNRAAENPCRSHTCEEAPVKPRVAGLQRLITEIGVQRHCADSSTAIGRRLAEFGHGRESPLRSLVDLAVLHNERHPRHRLDVFPRVLRNRHHVRDLTSRDRSMPVFHL